MSAWITLVGADGNPVPVAPFTEGGVYRVGGTIEATLNVTYNYGALYALVIPDYPGLLPLFQGKRAEDLIPVLEQAVAQLGTAQYRRDRDACPRCGYTPETPVSVLDLTYNTETRLVDYWAPTPGNAGYALNILLDWARQYPEATFDATG